MFRSFRVSFLFVFAAWLGETALGAQPTELFISEYIEGSSNNKAIEIYNGTGAAVNLAAGAYDLQVFLNGSASAGATIALTGSIANNDVYVVAHNLANATILAQADQTSSSLTHNGDDAVVLRKNGTVIDVLGQVGFDPGTEWGTGLTSTADNTLQRKNGICAGDADGSDTFDPAGEWSGFAADTFTGLGSHTPSFCSTIRLSIDDVTVTEGAAGTTIASFTVALSQPAGVGGVTFDIATQDGTATTADGDYVGNALLGQSIAQGDSDYTFDVTVNGDNNPETYETFLVNVANVTGAILLDGQGVGTIQTDDPTITPIHDVQGSASATPIAGATVTVEGVVTGDFQAQGAGELRGFFLQEEDVDADSDPATSEGLFVFCSGCPTAVAEGQRVRATGVVSEFVGMTEITASAAGAVVVTEAGNHLADLTAMAIDLPISDLVAVDDFYEPMEGMLVTFTDPLTVAEYFELFRYGQIELYEGGRPRQFCEDNPPDVTGYADHLAALARRRVILDDDDDIQNGPLSLPNTLQYVFHPRTNGGFSIGVQGTDFFRGGDLVNGLTGVLHWSWSGLTGTDAWRIRPTAANLTTFTVANPRPTVAAPALAGSIKAASMNLLNYFSTIDTTLSSTTGPCGPAGNQDCRGADSPAELDRQRARAALVICTLDADVYGLVEVENTTASGAVDHLLTAVNALCGGDDPYVFASTAGTLGTDAIRVAIIYRSATLQAQGAPVVDLDPVHNRPPTAQTFQVIDALNPAFGEVFTVVVNHLKSKGCSGATGLDLDQIDGQSCFNATRTAQAARLLTWVNGTVVPAAGDADVLLLGDFNSYAQEDPIAELTAGGYTDLMSSLLGAAGYSYLFDGQLGHLDYAFASAALAPQVTGIAPWHINADEVPLFDYNDEVKDTGEATFEEKPDGSALVPPRTVFEAGVPFRAADHDPVLVGLFPPAPVMSPFALTVDDGGNDVFEAGEAFTVQPAWENLGTATANDLVGGASNFTGPPGPAYTLSDAAASYGDVVAAAAASCAGQADCYAVSLAAATRPQVHWDATLDEGLSTGETHTWVLHVGESFGDAPITEPYYREIETLLHRGIVAGCGGGNYCPANPVTRGQLARLLLLAIEGAVYEPAACDQNGPLFDDVPWDDPLCRWIEEAAARQLFSACAGGRFCPDLPESREQLAVHVLRAIEHQAPGYTPPANGCDITQPYDDVPQASEFCVWIAELKARNLAASCAGGANYCRFGAVDREPLAGFLTRAFALDLYAP
jgi:predicted extracellular nuclease